MLIDEAARLFGECRYEHANIRFPLFDEDLEDASGLPDGVVHVAGQIREADAVIIATPEYNSMLSGVLKNALDWVSRSKPKPFADKPVAVMATGGNSGGGYALYSLRQALASFDADIMPGAGFTLPGSTRAFDESNRLVNEAKSEALQKLMQKLRAKAQV